MSVRSAPPQKKKIYIYIYIDAPQCPSIHMTLTMPLDLHHTNSFVELLQNNILIKMIKKNTDVYSQLCEINVPIQGYFIKSVIIHQGRIQKVRKMVVATVTKLATSKSHLSCLAYI